MTCQHILVIDDEPDIRDTLKDVLEFFGFKAAVAANGLEGLHQLEELGRPCLIFLDIMMPIMNGWEFLDTLKKSREYTDAGIPIVIVSAAPDVDRIERQGYRYLKKPANIDQLAAFAHEYCTKRH